MINTGSIWRYFYEDLWDFTQIFAEKGPVALAGSRLILDFRRRILDLMIDEIGF